jgi:hypothetical protein
MSGLLAFGEARGQLQKQRSSLTSLGVTGGAWTIDRVTSSV